MAKTDTRQQFPDLMTTVEVGKQLGVNPARVRVLHKQGRLVGRLCGNVLLFEPQSVYAFTPRANGRPRKKRQ